MALDATQVFKDALSAFTSSGGARAQGALAKAETHLQKLGGIAVRIEAKNLAGVIDAEDAAAMIKVEELALRALAKGVATQLRAALEKGINAALAVVVKAIEGATGLILK